MAEMVDDGGGRNADAEGRVRPKGLDGLEGIGGLGKPGAFEEGVDYFGDMLFKLLRSALCLAQREKVFPSGIGAVAPHDGLHYGIIVHQAGGLAVGITVSHDVFASCEGDVLKGLKGVGEAPEDDVGCDGVVGDEAGSVFGEAEGSLEYFVVDAAFPAVGTE